jgi:hypothetical protein
VTYHTEVASCWRIWRTKGIAEEFAAYGQSVAAALTAFDQRLYRFWRDAALDEYGRNIALYEEIYEVSDVLQAGFTVGAQALNSFHL